MLGFNKISNQIIKLHKSKKAKNEVDFELWDMIKAKSQKLDTFAGVANLFLCHFKSTTKNGEDFFAQKEQHQASFNWPPDPLSFLLCLYVYIVLCLLTRPTAEEYISYFTCEDCSFLLLIFSKLQRLKTFAYEVKSIGEQYQAFRFLQ